MQNAVCVIKVYRPATLSTCSALNTPFRLSLPALTVLFPLPRISTHPTSQSSFGTELVWNSVWEMDLPVWWVHISPHPKPPIPSEKLPPVPLVSQFMGFALATSLT